MKLVKTLKDIEKPTRVKYTETQHGVFTSNKCYLSTEGFLLQSVISNGYASVRKRVNDADELVERVDAKNFSDAKRKAKALLKKYGVSFFDEVRQGDKKDAAGENNVV